MKMKSLGFVVSFVLLLGGCFLKQTPPGNVVNKEVVSSVGIARLEEVSGAESTTTFEATFAAATPGRGSRPFRDLSSLDGGLTRVEARTPGCSAYKIKKGSRDAVKLLSVGKLYFGPALQENMTEIPENSDHDYKSSFKSSLPPTVYVMKSTGTPQIPAWGHSLSFPVKLENVAINSVSNMEDDTTVAVASAMKLEWDAPAVPHSGHIMLMELYSDQPGEVYMMRCLGLESDFGLDGAKRSWTIPANYMNVMPPSEKGLLFLSRVIAQDLNLPMFKVESQGMQTHLTKLVLQ